jgi:hypothetical protein
MSNPVNVREIKLWASAGIAIFIFSNLWIFAEDGFQLFGIFIGSIIAIFLFIYGVGYSELIDRPKEVEVTDSGIILYRKLGRKPFFIPWAGICKLNYGILKPSEVGWHNMDSYLFISKKKSMPIIRPIAEEIRERYKGEFGHYPSNAAWGGELFDKQ